MATLVDSSRNYADLRVLVYAPDLAADKLIEAIYAKSRQLASQRLLIKDGRYMYTPSNDYSKFNEDANTFKGERLIRFKNFKR